MHVIKRKRFFSKSQVFASKFQENIRKYYFGYTLVLLIWIHIWHYNNISNDYTQLSYESKWLQEIFEIIITITIQVNMNCIYSIYVYQILFYECKFLSWKRWTFKKNDIFKIAHSSKTLNKLNKKISIKKLSGIN